MKLVIGLTGGIGSGKSTALKAFKSLGADTFSADELSHELSRPGKPLFTQIVREFGRSVVAASGELNRAALALRVFRDAALRKRLERATHPVILREMKKRIRRARGPVVIVDVPLLFEVGLRKEFDATAVVSARKTQVLSRLRGRGMDRAEALRRMRAQMPPAEKEALADIVIRNEGSRKELLGKARDYFKAFELIAKSRTN